MKINDVSYTIIGCAIEVHKTLGPGLLESVYESALNYELKEAGFNTLTQVQVPVTYKNIQQEVGFRIDLLVEDKIIVELKSVEELKPVHFSQLLSTLDCQIKSLAY
jgi:GxxExxY protein